VSARWFGSLPCQTSEEEGGDAPQRSIRPFATGFLDTSHDAALATSQHTTRRSVPMSDEESK
jgi:hypothetical protein